MRLLNCSIVKPSLRRGTLLIAFLLSSILFLRPNVTMAQMTLDVTPKGQFANLGQITFPNLVSTGISLVLVVAALVFLFMLVIGGIRWMLSGGDKAGVEGARNQVTSALIGLLIVFATWGILTLINTVFGINILNLTIPSITGGGGGAPLDCIGNPADPQCRP